MADLQKPIVEARGLTKRYPGVVALDRVDFALEAGEVHVLFGENGAGKSTLISILAGASAPTSGSIEIAGEPVTVFTVRNARKLGVSAVFQEFSLVPTQTVLENLVLGEEPASSASCGGARDAAEPKRYSPRSNAASISTGPFHNCRAASSNSSRSPRRCAATCVSSSWTSRPRR